MKQEIFNNTTKAEDSKRQPKQLGLYEASHEHDACGVGMLVNIQGGKSHELVESALKVLENMRHRGAEGADNKTGDGAGIMLQIPHEFILLQGIPVPEKGKYGTGLLFLPKDGKDQAVILSVIIEEIEKEGLTLMHLRNVPTCPEILGEAALANEPDIKQIFITGFTESETADRKLYIIRKRIENRIRKSDIPTREDFYIVSLSTKNIVYKGMLPGSRLGVTAEQLAAHGGLPAGVEGLHFHVLCESRPEHLQKALEAVETHFGAYLDRIKWLNMGGGHLMTASWYDCDRLIALLKAFRSRHPNLRLILEPGSAFTWRTGFLVSTVEDIVENGGVTTAMLDVSFACHMPDCLEMPYKPAVIGAHEPADGEKRWRMGGTSCLAGDYCGDWAFDRELKVGERVVFEDMIHYTMVKTTMFNGVHHPSIVIARRDGRTDVIREFGYEDFRNRMS